VESGRQDARARCAWAGQEDSWWTARLRSICALERWRMQETRVRHCHWSFSQRLLMDDRPDGPVSSLSILIIYHNMLLMLLFYVLRLRYIYILATVYSMRFFVLGLYAFWVRFYLIFFTFTFTFLHLHLTLIVGCSVLLLCAILYPNRPYTITILYI